MAGIDQGKAHFDAIVKDVISEAHHSPSLLLPEEITYLREHALKKPLGVIHIWALGVGVVITGMYFGWNFGLPVGGPIGVADCLRALLGICRRTVGLRATNRGQRVRILNALVNVSGVPVRHHGNRTGGRRVRCIS